MKRFWIVLVVLVVLVGGALGLVWRLMSGLSAIEVSGGVLHWRVDGAYAEQRDDRLLEMVLHGRRPVMRELILGLDRAGRDDRIDGLLLEVAGLPASWAQVEELRDAVDRFAASGKPVVACLDQGGTKEYALALAGDEIALEPEGGLLIMGVTAEMTFLAETLQKLGIEADFVHIGKYKSAPEMLTRTDPTTPHREMMRAIVDDRWRRLVGMIAAGRGVPADTAAAWLDRGLWDGEGALAAGLVDTLLPAAAVRELRFPDVAVTEMEDYVLAGGRGGRAARRVALIYATGTIMSGESSRSSWQEVAGSETIAGRLREAAEDDAVDAVILRVDSPGGSATASDVIWQAAEAVRARKPLIVSMSGYAASGGYYICCGADSIFALPGTLTGSIGVFAGKADLSGLYDKLGVNREFVTRGENALMFADEHGFTPAQRQRLETVLGSFYDRFVAKVAGGRDLPDAAVREVAQGRVWTGDQAVPRGLVDGTGGLLRAVTAAKRMLGVPEGQRVALTTRERQLSFLERVLLKSLHESAAVELPPLGPAAALARQGSLAAAQLLDGTPAALMPMHLEVR